MASLKYSDLDLAVDYVSSGTLLNASAYICRETGKIWYESNDSYEDEELPDSLGNTNKYAEVPDKRAFDLGKSLVLRFASRKMPGKYEEIDSIFHRSGAYSRFKNFLSKHGALDAWYKYEQLATQEALCTWAKEEGFEIELESDKIAT